MTNLEMLLGRSREEMKDVDFDRLVTERTPESTQLDFKQEHYKDGQDLATDVSALANSVGGSIVIGIQEMDGAAGKVTPVEVSDEQTLRMQQWLASYVTPRLDAEIRPLPTASDPQRGIYVIDVPPSARAPHAVAKGTSLRYHRRSGPRNNPLSEPEIAEAYDSRFSRLRSREDRQQELLTAAGPPKYQDDDREPWVVVTLMPVYPGSFEISARSSRGIREWAKSTCEPLLRGDASRGFTPLVTPSVGRVSVGLQFREDEPTFGYYLQLYTDGSASVAVPLVTFDRTSRVSERGRIRAVLSTRSPDPHARQPSRV
jgi:Putative DNA-binding domain